MLAESRNRVLRLFESGEPSTADVVAAVEADVALAVTVLRLANRVDGRMRGRVESAVKGVEVLSPRTVHSIASKARTFDFFERTAVWQGVPERFRLHAVATQRAADRLARELGYEARDRLMVTSLLHDIGKLVLVHAYPGYPRQIHAEARTPEERIQSERRELGVDHALVGGVLARRWGLPKSIASVIERHHAEDVDGEAALVRLADMLAHYTLGGSVSPSELLNVVAPRRHRPARAADRHVRPAAAQLRRPAVARSTRARCRRARSRSCAAWPAGWSTSRSLPSSACRPAPSGPTCTTCTASSARWIAPRRF